MTPQHCDEAEDDLDSDDSVTEYRIETCRCESHCDDDADERKFYVPPAVMGQILRILESGNYEYTSED